MKNKLSNPERQKLAQAEFNRLNQEVIDQAMLEAEVERCKDPRYFYDTWCQVGDQKPPPHPNAENFKRAEQIRRKYEQAKQGTRTADGNIIWENKDPF